MQGIRRSIVAAALLAVGAGLPASSSNAAAEYYALTRIDTSSAPLTISGGTVEGTPQLEQDSFFAPVFYQTSLSDIVMGDVTAAAKAFASRGALRISARGAQGAQGGIASGAGAYNGFAIGFANARVRFDDLIVSAVGAGGAAAIPVSFRFSVAGSLPDVRAEGTVFGTQQLMNSPDVTLGGASSRVDFFFQVSDGSGLLMAASGLARSDQNPTYGGPLQPVTYSDFGVFSGRQANLQGGPGFIVQTAPRLLPVGVPLMLSLELRGQAASGFTFPEGGGLYGGDAMLDFDHTVTFALDQVALLPDGYTLNSLQAGINNNVWAPVPLPASGLFLLTGLAAMVGRGRRRFR